MFRLLDLPYELREIIWELCLPRRVYDLDHLWNPAFYRSTYGLESPDEPCDTHRTAVDNVCPPVIAQVCRESRAIAARALSCPDVPGSGYPDGALSVRPETQQQRPLFCLTDRARSVPHLYYDPYCDVRFNVTAVSPFKSPLQYLADAANVFTRCGGRRGPSFMFRLLSAQCSGDIIEIPDSPTRLNEADMPVAKMDIPTEQELATMTTQNKEMWENMIRNVRALERWEQWTVVMDIIVIHCSDHRGTASNLFGLLGDAPIQIIDADDRESIAVYSELARECEAEHAPSAEQDFSSTLTHPDLMRRQLKYVLWRSGYPSHLFERLQPAIMFRLCRRQCYKHEGTFPEGDITIRLLSD